MGLAAIHCVQTGREEERIYFVVIRSSDLFMICIARSVDCTGARAPRAGNQKTSKHQDKGETFTHLTVVDVKLA